MPSLSEPNEELDLDYAGPLDKNWGNSKYLLLCIGFSEFPSGKVMNNTSASSLLCFMSDYCHLHGYPKSIRADHGSCFISNDFENLCEKNNFNLILCTVGDHRYNGVVEHLIYATKANFMAISFNERKPTLNVAIDKIVWNIRSTKQSSIECSSFSKHFERLLNTIWKSLVSHAIELIKGNSIMSKDRSQEWGTDDNIEDGYLENSVADKRGYENDPAAKKQNKICKEHRYSILSAKEVIGLGRRLTEGKSNRILNPLLENHCLIPHIGLPSITVVYSENWT